MATMGPPAGEHQWVAEHFDPAVNNRLNKNALGEIRGFFVAEAGLEPATPRL